VPYDREAMAALARRNSQPELASALATGWIRSAQNKTAGYSPAVFRNNYRA